MANYSDLYSTLNDRPVFLLLGQRYLALETGIDPLLADIIHKYKISNSSSVIGYDSLFSEDISWNWLWERCRRYSVPKWLQTVAEFAWSGIYTSAIDTVSLEAFRASWREVQPLFDMKYKPENPRSRSKLHMTYLYGRVDRGDQQDQRTPSTKREYRLRNQTAINMLQRLPELITPLGYLFIEGYNFHSDWLQLLELLPVIDLLKEKQTHLFSVSDSLLADPEIADYVNEGLITLHKERLDQFLLEGTNFGLELGKTSEDVKYGRNIRIKGTNFNIPADLWNTVSRSAIILDDAILSVPPPISDDKKYIEYRNFLSNSSIKPIWSGFSSERAFNFVRDFEHPLLSKVKKKLQIRELEESPIILHGQTGTGKTVALSNLAYQVRSEGLYPVLFIERKLYEPTSADLDAFCKYVEDNDSLTTLIVWDGMRNMEAYYRLHRTLSARGRKVVIVGSCYAIDGQVLQRMKNAGDFVEAPIELSDTEKQRFQTYLTQFDSTLFKQIEAVGSDLKHPLDASFLVSLFRLLSSTRSQIREGIGSEFRHAQHEMTQRIRNRVETYGDYINSPIAYAMWKAGLLTEDHVLSTETENIIGEELSQSDLLMRLIVVPGRFGLEIPLELLLRVLDKQNNIDFVEILGQDTVFRWTEDANGNLSVSARHPLEAQIYADLAIGSAKYEVELAGRLIREVRDIGLVTEDNEIQFAVELVRRMGPNYPGTSRYNFLLRELANDLTILRQERGIRNPRLMLQEAVLLREAARVIQKQGENAAEQNPESTSLELLLQAEAILDEALTLLGDSLSDANLRFNIFVEKAAGQGSQAIHYYAQSDLRASENYQKSRELLLTARTLDPENFYPIDILGWTTRDYLKSSIPTDVERAEAQATILNVFTLAEVESYSADQEEQFQRRRMEIARVLHDQHLEQDAFEKLIQIGSSAGYFLKAVDLAGEDLSGIHRVEAQLTKSQIHRAISAVEFLQSNFEAILKDARTLNFLLRLWWMTKTGKPMFWEERQTVPFSKLDWKYCFDLITRMQNLEELYRSRSITYIRGVAEFHLGALDEAISTFRELERSSEYMSGRRRIIRSYVASKPDGSPRRYSGEVEWYDEKTRRGQVRVYELGEKITFFGNEFRRDFRKGDALPEFHVAFNFLNIVADPVSFLSQK